MIYTSNAIDSVNAQLRKTLKSRGYCASDEAVSKLICLDPRNITADWSRSTHDWKLAMNRSAILY